MNYKELNVRLDEIKFSDPVRDLALELTVEMDEATLHRLLINRKNDPIAVELINKFRDVVNGVPSINKYGYATVEVPPTGLK